YLAPTLALTGTLLALFAYLAPVVLFPGSLSLLAITPSGGNGPSIFIGALGSCARAKSGAPLACTGASFSPKYDLTGFPNNAPLTVLSRPPPVAPGFISVSLGVSFVFFITFTLLSFRHKLGPDMAKTVNKPSFNRFNAWVGSLGWFIGLASFLAIRLWFGKAAQDFNASKNSGQLVARDRNGFVLVWFAYAFLGVPVLLSLLK
ncbi:hypothetical protein L218DRAFT_810236, partial [Marasmius fiardii PR-910]